MGIVETGDDRAELRDRLQQGLLDRIEKRLMVLLGKSLDTNRHLEERWLEIRRELEAVQAEKNRLGQELASTQEERDRLQGELSSAQEGLDWLQGELSSAQEGRDWLQGELSSAQEGRDWLGRKLGVVTEERERLDREIAVARDEAAATRGDLFRTKAELEQARARIGKMLSSRSWRLTRPLRRLVATFRR